MNCPYGCSSREGDRWSPVRSASGGADERKVRAPQGKVVDNAHRDPVIGVSGKVPQKIYRPPARE